MPMLAEAGVHQGLAAGAAYGDVSGFFEHLCHRTLRTEAAPLGFPRPLLELALRPKHNEVVDVIGTAFHDMATAF